MLGASGSGEGTESVGRGGRHRVAAMLADVEVGTGVRHARFTFVQLWEFQLRCN